MVLLRGSSATSIRALLTFRPALVATRKNPDIKALNERLPAADKSKMCATGAAMRKLVHICYGVVKNQVPYQAQTVQP